jgi:hypothetical protein
MTIRGNGVYEHWYTQFNSEVGALNNLIGVVMTSFFSFRFRI